jgi:hypothetical protein
VNLTKLAKKLKCSPHTLYAHRNYGDLDEYIRNRTILVEHGAEKRPKISTVDFMGVTYTYSQLATMMGLSLGTIRSYASDGSLLTRLEKRWQYAPDTARAPRTQLALRLLGIVESRKDHPVMAKLLAMAAAEKE